MVDTINESEITTNKIVFFIKYSLRIIKTRYLLRLSVIQFGKVRKLVSYEVHE